jgi:hypothetical protein
MAGVGVVVVVAAGGLAYYLASQQPPAPRHHHHEHASLSARVVSQETVGLIDFGPDDDGDAFQHDADDHPLVLQPAQAGVDFVTISAAEMKGGTPLWTANDMSDGSVIFVYTPTGQCLTASGSRVRLAHCNLRLGQRWQPANATTTLGQAISAYANKRTGTCLTGPSGRSAEGKAAKSGPATLAACGPVRDRSQEIAFWWGS